ncbi:MAG: hypothetical protein PHE68_05065, partial [Candidatus Peribacteraceae bacterium]|nr:hypothetical protein [Candidatus Peribacteraceae bacterium]
YSSSSSSSSSSSFAYSFSSSSSSSRSNSSFAPPLYCKDSDGGLNYEVTGYVVDDSSGRRIIIWDTCRSNKTVAEAYCSQSGPTVQEHDCPGRCDGGRCVQSSSNNSIPVFSASASFSSRPPASFSSISFSSSSSSSSRSTSSSSSSSRSTSSSSSSSSRRSSQCLSPAAIDRGITHSLLLDSNKDVYAWGANGAGMLGNGTKQDSTVPVRVKGAGGQGYLSDIAEISGGHIHSLAVGSDGGVYAWGSNDFGELGIGTRGNPMNPVRVKGVGGQGYLSDIIAVSGGYFHSLALGRDGGVYAWGWNNSGVLGDGTFDSNNISSVPVRVKGVGGQGYLSDIIAISAGYQGALALGRDGSVYAWGNGSTVPIRVRGVDGQGFLTGITAIAAGSQHFLALSNDGSVYAWGRNDFGQLGIGSTAGPYNPTRVKGVGGQGYLSGIIAISNTGHHSLALGQDGSVYAWGQNSNGQLGNNSQMNSFVPVKALDPSGAGELSAITAISSELGRSLALGADGSVYAWGLSDITPFPMLSKVPVKVINGCSSVNTLSSSCTENDGGIIYSQRGEVIWNGETQWDSCYDSTTIIEKYCTDSGPLSIIAKCSGQCVRGACQ